MKKFLTRLGVEPRSEDPRFLEASRASLEHARAYAQAQKFEDKLEAALQVPADPALKESILAQVVSQPKTTSHARTAGWLALAASMLVMLGAASFLWPTADADAALREAFVTHLNHPEPALTARQSLTDQRIMARFAERGIPLRKPIEQVSYFSPCVIGGQPAVHLVLTDQAQDQVTLMLIPGRHLDTSHHFSMDGITVRLDDTTAGALALFGHQGQDLGGIMRDLLRNIDGPQRRVAAL